MESSPQTDAATLNHPSDQLPAIAPDQLPARVPKWHNRTSVEAWIRRVMRQKELTPVDVAQLATLPVRLKAFALTLPEFQEIVDALVFDEFLGLEKLNQSRWRALCWVKSVNRNKKPRAPFKAKGAIVDVRPEIEVAAVDQ